MKRNRDEHVRESNMSGKRTTEEVRVERQIVRRLYATIHVSSECSSRPSLVLISRPTSPSLDPIPRKHAKSATLHSTNTTRDLLVRILEPPPCNIQTLTLPRDREPIIIRRVPSLSVQSIITRPDLESYSVRDVGACVEAVVCPR